MTEEVMWAGRYIVAKRRGTWEYVGRIGNMTAAVILAVVDGDVLLVEQDRVPLGRRSLELPAGLVGDSGDTESIADAAARELEEETGYRAGRIELLGEFNASPGMVSESFTLVRAHDLVRTGAGGGVEGENITVHRIALADAPAFIAQKRAEDVGIDVKLLLLLAGQWLGA